MMEKEYSDLIYAVPEGLCEDGSDLCELTRDEIPWDRVPKLVELLRGDEWVAFEASRLLCYWGDDNGYKHLYWFVCERPILEEIWMPHRLHGYDETYKAAMEALIGYWAFHATYEDGEPARRKIFAPIERIILLASTREFEINHLFWLVEEEQFYEYIPAIKKYFSAIISESIDFYWKIADCAKFLEKVDPRFLADTLQFDGKTLEDLTANCRRTF